MMNIYRLPANIPMWDTETEFFVAAHDNYDALNLLHQSFQDEVDARDFTNTVDPQKARHAALEYAAYKMDAFRETILFAIALPEQVEPAIIHSVYTPG
jgi:hypothetical protein